MIGVMNTITRAVTNADVIRKKTMSFIAIGVVVAIDVTAVVFV